MSSTIKDSINFFRHLQKTRGEIIKWSDKLLIFTRDKMRRVGRVNRRKWTLDFYEKLQEVNKESQKRKLTQYTP